jgi:hypothetical protein
VGDPPRQTEDPQSPPCINYFEGDNGGATAKGVTADEIRVAVTKGSPEWPTHYEALAKHFNARYELYGRKLRITEVLYDPQHPDAATAEADEAVDAFAVLEEYGGSNFDMSQFQRDAARRGMLTVLNWTTPASADFYRELAPYAWNYAPVIDEVQRGAADLVCSSLVDRPARYAGPDLRARERKFGVFRGPGVDVSQFKRLVARCGVDDVPVYDVRLGMTSETKEGTWLSARTDNVTSVLLFVTGDTYTQWALSSARDDYQPELVTTGMGVHENEAQWMLAGRASDRSRLFGVWGTNKLLPASDSPSHWAYREATGASDPNLTHLYNGAYHQLLVLASGIQMAGPHLTPESFARGLQKASFPNPGAGDAPYYQARAGFGPGDYAMIDTFAAAWFNDSAPSYGGIGVSQRGGWCYVRHGRRWDHGAWPDVSTEFHDPLNCR